jgi:RimJ/RimL family protein N-acetyltransferase
MPGNKASTRIMEKLGLEFECEFESDGVRLVRYPIHRAQYATAQAWRRNITPQA